MNLLTTEQRQVDHLYELRDLAVGSPIIDLKFVSYWEKLRESYGLAKLLLIIESYHKEKKI